MKINDEDHQAGVTEATKYSALILGAVMNEVAYLEIVIDIFLADYFAKGIPKTEF